MTDANAVRGERKSVAAGGGEERGARSVSLVRDSARELKNFSTVNTAPGA